ncbi:MAG: sulfite exporter TauE/SafE family protein [Woeseia sp.]
MISLAAVFLLVAMLYASVGFGGGSTYTAILIESGLAPELVPPLALLCNVVVVSGGVWHFARAGHLDLKFATPLIAASVPAAFIGGYMRLSENTFLLILGLALLVAGSLLALDRSSGSNGGEPSRRKSMAAPLTWTLGAVLGGLAGVTGIGGGIYLAPVLHLFRLASAKTVAATCSLFILVNSLSGLAGQLSKLGPATALLIEDRYLFLPLAVLVGGQLGSRIAARRLPAAPIRRITGLLIVLVALRILWRA